MWAVKGHYYGPTFYNYPYTFGLLFGLGLYARYTADPDGFRAGYDDLLSSTGLADAATLAARFGIDVRGRRLLARQPGRDPGEDRGVRAARVVRDRGPTGWSARSLSAWTSPAGVQSDAKSGMIERLFKAVSHLTATSIRTRRQQQAMGS